MLILAVAGWLAAQAAESKDVIAFTAVLLAAFVGILAVQAKFGPPQRADERAVKRSEEAALFAIRANFVVGALGSAYAELLGFHQVAVLLGFAAAIPTILWFITYWVLNWRDVA